MSNKNNKNKKKKSNNSFSSKYEVEEKKDRYDNPVKSKAGKIMIVILAVAMIGGSLFGLTYAIVQYFLH